MKGMEAGERVEQRPFILLEHLSAGNLISFVHRRLFTTRSPENPRPPFHSLLRPSAIFLSLYGDEAFILPAKGNSEGRAMSSAHC